MMAKRNPTKKANGKARSENAPTLRELRRLERLMAVRYHLVLAHAEIEALFGAIREGKL